jgi:hypothetical protein
MPFVDLNRCTFWNTSVSVLYGSILDMCCVAGLIWTLLSSQTHPKQPGTGPAHIDSRAIFNQFRCLTVRLTSIDHPQIEGAYISGLRAANFIFLVSVWSSGEWRTRRNHWICFLHIGWLRYKLTNISWTVSPSNCAYSLSDKVSYFSFLSKSSFKTSPWTWQARDLQWTRIGHPRFYPQGSHAFEWADSLVLTENINTILWRGEFGEFQLVSWSIFWKF